MSPAQLSEAAEAFILPKSSSQHCGCMTPRAAPSRGGQAARGSFCTKPSARARGCCPKWAPPALVPDFGAVPPLLCYLQHPEVGLVPAQSWKEQGCRGFSPALLWPGFLHMQCAEF